MRQNKEIRFLFLLVVLVLSCHCPASANLRFQRFSNREGFNQNTITSIQKDKYGILWFGTPNGLIKYDGYEFYSYTPDFSGEEVSFQVSDNLIEVEPSLSQVSEMCVINDNELLFSNENGLFCLEFEAPDYARNPIIKSVHRYAVLEDQRIHVIQLRTDLLPYIYTAFYGYNQKGIPPFRAMVLESGYDSKEILSGGELDDSENPYEEQKRTELTDQYMMGPSILVAPVFTGQKERKVVLPKGRWYDFYTGKYAWNGGI